VGLKPDLDNQLATFSALTLLGHLACKNRPENRLPLLTRLLLKSPVVKAVIGFCLRLHDL